MTKLLTWGEVLRSVAEARDKGRIVSNFFPDEKRMTRWCEAGDFSYVECGGTTFLVRRQASFSSLFFLAESSDFLAQDVSILMRENAHIRFVVDVLGRDAVREPLESVFRAGGFHVLTTLQRMSRKTPAEEYKVESGIGLAQSDDALAVLRLLQENFIAEEKQIPCLEDIQEWIAASEIFVTKGRNNAIEGFVIFDLSLAALYLRYWFVSPDIRGNGVGGKLMRSMFAVGANTKRQYFWVKTDNETAILRYRHYGFEFEPLKDVVLEHG